MMTLAAHRILISPSCLQLHSEPAGGVHSAAGLPEAPAGQQGAFRGPAAAAAGTAAAGERGTQAAAAGRAPEAHRGAEGAAAAAGGGEDLLGPPWKPTPLGHFLSVPSPGGAMVHWEHIP